MLTLAAINSEKLLYTKFFFPEFCSPKLGGCIIHECVLYTNNHVHYCFKF